MPPKSKNNKSKRRNRNSDSTVSSNSSFADKLVNGFKLRFPMTQKQDKMTKDEITCETEIEDVNRNVDIIKTERDEEEEDDDETAEDLSTLIEDCETDTKNCDTKDEVLESDDLALSIAREVVDDLLNGMQDYVDKRNEKVRNRKTYVIENDSSSGEDISNGDEQLLECHNTTLLNSIEPSESSNNHHKNTLNAANILNALNTKIWKSFRLQKIEENSVSTDKLERNEKRKSARSFFGRSSKTKDARSTAAEDQFDSLTDLTECGLSRSKSLTKSRRYASAVDISREEPLSRKQSFVGRLTKFISGGEPNVLKRSLSVRDLPKKPKDSKDRLSGAEWALKSLAANDTGVSYDDLSFVNYDVFNTVSYDTNVKSDVCHRSLKNLQRAQSFQCKSSTADRSNLHHTNSVNIRNCQSNIDLSDSNSGAVSLPSLHHIAENASDNTRQHKYRRRPQSTSSEDGPAGSFKSAGSGCAKLRRHNACRQKPRDVTPAPSDQSVRSRSLNHLDTLEMRQAVAASVDPALKDSRSEPDCTKPVLPAPPGALAVPEVPPTPTVETATIGRRYLLSKSQVSSSEYFSVNCELGDDSGFGAGKEEFLPAIRGITLGDAISKVCERRNIELNSCDIWLQDRESNTHTWLCLTQDTGGLAGRNIRITAKDASNKLLKTTGTNHIRKLSGSHRPRTTSFFSTSTEDSTISASSTSLTQDGRLSLQDFELGKKQTKQRWSGFFSNNKDTKMESLSEQLNHYAKNGVPTVLNYPQGQCESVDALYNLEEDWRDIVNSSDLTEKQQQQQTALWELITTEVAYIKTLKVVTDLFLACLKNLQANQLLKEIDTEQLFSNITEILDTSVCFWRNFLFPLVRQMRDTRVPQSVLCLQEGFVHMRDNFYAYFRYCAEQQRCQHYCKENHAHNELFTAYLAWCETQKECNRLRLMDILVRPMQRLTKYGLLLKAILKNTDDDFEKDCLNMMIKSVDDFVNSVNSSLKQKQDNERLKGIIARIESYDAVETKDDDIERLVKSHSQLDLNGPMLGCISERKRHLLLEGDLKLKDNLTSKMEVHCFLLTDMLLVCKPSTKKGGSAMRVIRQPYLVDRLVVTELTRETPSLALVYLNEFKMAVAAFILQNNDAKKLKSWKDCILKAQGLYAQARQMSNVVGEESLDADFSLDYSLEGDFHSLQLAPRSPLASSSRASRVSSLAHSHSGSVEMNDQSSIGSANNASRAISIEYENRTASISSDEGVQSVPPAAAAAAADKSPSSQKTSFKHRLFNQSPRISTPNTLSVQPYGNLGQSLPNLTLGSPNVGTVSFSNTQNTLSVPNTTKNSQHLLSPNHRGISYPPPSPTRGNLRRGFAISQSKNPPLLKTRHVNSTAGTSGTGQPPTSFDFDVPVIAGVSPPNDHCDSFSRGQHRQAMLKRFYRNDNKRYHTAGVVDDIKRDDNRDSSIHKRLSWNCGSTSAPTPNNDVEDHRM